MALICTKKVRGKSSLKRVQLQPNAFGQRKKTEHSPVSLRIQRKNPISPMSAARCSVFLKAIPAVIYTCSQRLGCFITDLCSWKSQPGKQHPTEILQGSNRIFLKISIFAQQQGIQERRINCILTNPVITML